MATEHRWQATTDDWETVGNWASGQVPGAGGAGNDTALFDDGSQVSPATNLDQSAANRLKKIVVTPEFSGDIGAPGSPLTHHFSSDTDGKSRIIHRGSGSFYFTGKAATTNDVVVDSVNMVSAFNAEGGVLRNLFVKRGRANISATTGLDGYAIVDGPGAHLVIEARAGAEDRPAWIIMTSGLCENKRSMTGSDRIILLGGRLIQTGLVPNTTMIIIAPGAIMEYPARAATGPAQPDLICAGVFDIAGAFQNFILDDQILTLGGHIAGSPVGGELTPNAVHIDLGDDYP